MASDDNGWKMPKEKVNKNQRANNRQRTAKANSSTDVDMWADFDKNFETFLALSPAEKDKQAKELWEKVQRALNQIVSTSDFVQIIKSIHHSIKLPTSSDLVPDHAQDLDSPEQTGLEFVSLRESAIDQSYQPPNLFIDYQSVLVKLLLKNDIGKVQSTTSTSTNKTPSRHYTHSSLGIGSISKHQSSLYQFAFYLLFTVCFQPHPQHAASSPDSTQSKALPACLYPNIMIYDPMFSPLDIYLFKALGLNVLGNTEGQIPFHLAFPNQPQASLISAPSSTSTSTSPSTHHISFIPHCPAGMSHNLISSLWLNLHNTTIIANGFDRVLDALPIPQRFSAQLQPQPKKKAQIDPIDKQRDQVTASLFPKSSPQLSTLFQQTGPKNTFSQSIPQYLFGLDTLADYLNTTQIAPKATTFTDPTTKQIQIIPLQPTSKILPTLGLLLTKPWLSETKIAYTPTSSILNDMSIHSFNAPLKLGETCTLATLLAECQHIPPYSPPQSSNPELIPMSVRPR